MIAFVCVTKLEAYPWARCLMSCNACPHGFHRALVTGFAKQQSELLWLQGRKQERKRQARSLAAHLHIRRFWRVWRERVLELRARAREGLNDALSFAFATYAGTHQQRGLGLQASKFGMPRHNSACTCQLMVDWFPEFSSPTIIARL